MFLLEKHVFEDGNGNAVFLFHPEKYTSENNGTTSIVITKDVKVIDFLALMREMDLEINTFNAEALVVALLEKKDSEEVAEYA